MIYIRHSLFSPRVAIPESTFQTEGLVELKGVLRDTLAGEQVLDALLYLLLHKVVERGEGSGGGQHYIDPFDNPHLDMPSYSLGLTLDPESLPSGSGTSQMPPAPSSGSIAFQSPNLSAYRFGRFSAPPPPGTAGASTPHQPIS
ncbi:hypothetical protein M9H77_31466 [Catharanthus roseus]|uniref:Uncharacterized protein n=1 Tax=Catharanthus roseus TaxID=4058 RepID=A0ACC0A0H5_CATRO|nr:hypothetical protein M9H77_31466 [Catharanthus roseus]